MVTTARVRPIGSAPRKPRARRTRFARVRPVLRSLLRSLGWGLRRAGRALLAAPLAVRIVVFAIALVIVWSAVNWSVPGDPQAERAVLPGERRAHQGAGRDLAAATSRSSAGTRPPSITPELLAALAQVEGAGNPVARTYWRWRLTWNPFEVVPARVERGRHVPDHRRDVPARRSATASTTTCAIDDGPGTTDDRAGSTASTRACCRATRSS